MASTQTRCPMLRRHQQAFQAARPVPQSLQGHVRQRMHQGGVQRQGVACASTMVKDEVRSDVEYLLAQKFWDGDVMRCLGASTRAKKILLLSVQVYSVSVYVEADKCAKELGVRERGGFFANDDDFCSAILDGAFKKALVVRLLRDIEGSTFADALNDTLAPRMTLAGETANLTEFRSFMETKSLSTGTEVVMLWSVDELDLLVTPPSTDRNYETMQPEKRIKSVTLCRSLFEIFLGSNSVVPQARKVWVAGAKQLLESENVKRASRKQA